MLFWYIFFILIVFSPTLYTYGFGGFESIKIAFLILTASLMLIAWLKNKKSTITIQKPLTTIILLFIAVYIVVRSFFVEGLTLAWLGTHLTNLGAFTWLVFVLVLVALTNKVASQRVRQTIVLTSFLSLVAVLLSALFQQIGLMGGDWYNFDDPERGRFLFGSIGSPAYLGIVLSMLILISWPLFQANNQRLRLFFRIIIFIGIATVLLTKSLTGIFVLLLGLIIYFSNAYSKMSKQVFIISFLFITLMPFTLLNTRVQEIISPLAPSLVDRAYIWQTVGNPLDNIPQALFGVGSDHWQFIYDQNFPAKRVPLPAVTEEQPHNFTLEIIAEWGFVGLLLVLTFSYFLISESRLKKKEAVDLLLLWLILQFNFISASLLVLIFISYVLAFKTIKLRTKRLKIPTEKILLPASFILIFSLVFGSGAVISSLANYYGNIESFNHRFANAVTIFEKAKQYSLIDRPFTLMQLSEARANLAITNGDYNNYAELEQDLLKSLKGEPSAKQYATAIKILGVYAETDPRASRELSRKANYFEEVWASHPKHQQLRGALKKAGWL